MWSTPNWYIVVDHPCVELFFWSLPPNSTALSEKAPLSLSMYLIPRDSHISVYRTKINWALAKLAHFFYFVHLCRWPLPAPTFYRRVLTTVTSHYSPSPHTVLMNAFDLKMHKMEQINTTLSTECEYQSIRKRLSTNTYIWKVGDGKHSYSLSIYIESIRTPLMAGA